MALPPTALERIWAMPTASVGAPPARERIVISPTSLRSRSAHRALITKPQPEIAGAAVSRRCADHGCRACSCAKYRPGLDHEAATSAMMATNDSTSIAP